MASEEMLVKVPVVFTLPDGKVIRTKYPRLTVRSFRNGSLIPFPYGNGLATVSKLSDVYRAYESAVKHSTAEHRQVLKRLRVHPVVEPHWSDMPHTKRINMSVRFKFCIEMFLIALMNTRQKFFSIKSLKEEVAQYFEPNQYEQFVDDILFELEGRNVLEKKNGFLSGHTLYRLKKGAANVIQGDRKPGRGRKSSAGSSVREQVQQSARSQVQHRSGSVTPSGSEGRPYSPSGHSESVRDDSGLCSREESNQGRIGSPKRSRGDVGLSSGGSNNGRKHLSTRLKSAAHTVR